MRVVVSDACCLIDLDKVEAVVEVLRLPFDFVVPDILYANEVRSLQNISPEELPSHGLELRELSGASVARAQAYFQQNRELSLNDCFALVLAEAEENAILFTGDGALRAFASSRGIQTHGVLWAVEQMVDAAIIDKATALAALEVFREDPLVRLKSSLIATVARRIRSKSYG